MIIWIASYPRSGNNFTRRLLERSYGIKTYAIYDEPRQPKIDVEMARNAEETYLVKTHDLPEDDSPALYLVRDGRDALVSYAHFAYVHETASHPDSRTRLLLHTSYLRYRLIWKFRRRQHNQPLTFPKYSIKFRTQRVNPATSQELHTILHKLIVYNKSFGGWGPNVLAWIQRETPTQVIKFEDLIQSATPLEIIRAALQALGYPLAHVESSPLDFKKMKQARPDLFRRGKAGSHKDEMPEYLEALFWQHHGHVMEALGYPR
jgi:hypothetical protein